MPKTASQWSGSPSIRGSSESTQMVLLTFSLVGLLFCWSLETTYCTPYLLSLGLSKARTSLVYIAGPLSGLIMQPVVGALADRSTSKYGRRRPVMVVGSIVVGVCLLLLGWTKEVVSLFFRDEQTQKRAALVVAVAIIYVVDFAINAVQACCRSLIVDALPIDKQQSGSAWATRVGGAGNLLSYGIGTLDLVSILPGWFGGDTQFKKMTVISVLMLWFATGVTCYSVTERVLVSSTESDVSIWAILPSLWRQSLNLPRRVQAICWVQFWAWIGWFPFMFYSSTWVGEIYYRYEHKPDPSEEHDALGNIGRLGSFSLVLFSMVTFAGSVVLPSLIKQAVPSTQANKTFTPRLPPSLPSSIQRVLLVASRLPKPTLLTAWQLAHLAFAFIMVWSPFVRSLSSATLLVALCGVPSVIGSWAPFAEMGIEINRAATGNPSHGVRDSGRAMLANGNYSAVRASIDEDDIEMPMKDLGRPRTGSVLHLSHPDSDDEDGTTGELSGVYLGVLNVYTTLPQFIGTFIGWIVFSIFEPDRSQVKDEDPEHHRWLDTKGINGISVCFFIGAMCAIVAAEATRRLKLLV